MRLIWQAWLDIDYLALSSVAGFWQFYAQITAVKLCACFSGILLALFLSTLVASKSLSQLYVKWQDKDKFHTPPKPEDQHTQDRLKARRFVPQGGAGTTTCVFRFRHLDSGVYRAQ